MRNYSIFKSGFIFFMLFVAGGAAVFAQEGSQWEEAIQQFEAKDKTSPPPEEGILFVGSSSFAMWKDLEERFPDKKVFNRGFGGSQMTDVIQYAQRVIIAYQPAQVVVYEGDNDIASGKSPGTVLRDAKTLVQIIEDTLPDTQISFISVKPSLARWNLRKKYERANRKLEKYARKKDKVEFIDVWDPMLNEAGEPIADIFLEDGLHMNKKGYDIWTEQIEPHLK